MRRPSHMKQPTPAYWSFLCSSCWKWEAAWSREDFAFEEHDADDDLERANDLERAVVYRPSKKKNKQEKKQREQRKQEKGEERHI